MALSTTTLHRGCVFASFFPPNSHSLYHTSKFLLPVSTSSSLRNPLDRISSNSHKTLNGFQSRTDQTQLHVQPSAAGAKCWGCLPLQAYARPLIAYSNSPQSKKQGNLLPCTQWLAEVLRAYDAPKSQQPAQR